MRVALHILVFALTFSINVRVKAAQLLTLPVAKTVIEQPEGCVKTGSVCAVMTKDHQRWTWEMSPGVRVTLGANTIVARVDDHTLRLVRGVAWVRAEETVQVESEFGRVQAEKTDFWVLRLDQKFWVRASRDELRLLPRGASEALGLPAGCENWLGPVNAQGEARIGFAQVISSEEHVRLWAQLYDGPKKGFRDEVKEFTEIQAHAIDVVTEQNKQLIERTLASLAEEQERARIARERAAAERQQLRALFRRKNGLDL